jgi:hypothetical protein
LEERKQPIGFLDQTALKWARFMGGQQQQQSAALAPAQADPRAEFRGGGPQQPAAAQEPEQKADIRRTLSKYARMAFGPPIILLMLGAGVGCVATGFRSGPTR